ncbi:hypothetical protein H0H81_000019 [Sphagnurus paluster]|uniref:Tail specific protease domain-containing protein n=1 Tax=Sphagnurus paluster TaxID=117069 RepID=A0A9P7FYY9_9AGAR|nr:hypothetical protein H0H81_000019 [Sphagnurus paluster]
MYVGTFDGDFVGFQDDVVAAVDSFKEAGVTQLLIDVTNNGGGGFNSTQRATPFVQRIVAAEIELGLDTSVAYYTGDNYAFENGTIIPSSYNYMSPPLPFEVNGRQDPTSQRVHDVCEQFFFPTLTTTPPFDLRLYTRVRSKIAIGE